ncbi:hypothetical protein K788_0005984 (plasmid) [Paraburkholderia caribensis MBA4]|uniref:Uncharacterized protein n=1 Tax=Paraburkholderia caribensis MBA4 TaxID=1323664 RepID=A0A0P0RR97_9BURK|nr:hypothetical protein K788_0005984 [Paraburkholderia caribensis MBA4]
MVAKRIRRAAGNEDFELYALGAQGDDVGGELRRRDIRDEVLRRAKLCGAHDSGCHNGQLSRWD